MPIPLNRNSLASSPPETLWHYTTAGGLRSILTSRALYATDVYFLNDASELDFGLGLIGTALLERAVQTHDPSRGECLRRVVDMELTRKIYIGRWSHYVSCFCDRGDLLSQWRGYGPSGGFSIGFATTTLPGGYHKVLYGPTEAAELISRVVEDIDPDPIGPHGSQLEHALGVVPIAASIMKHKGFREEREWRLVVQEHIKAPDGLRFRDGPLGVAPYREIPFQRAAVREIFVGPGSHQDVRMRGLRTFLDSLGGGFEVVKITPSPIPLRY